MKKNFILCILLSFSLNVSGQNYDTDNSITKQKYGFKLGDLIIIEDKIISNNKFIQAPVLVIQKYNELKLIQKTNTIIQESEKHIFINKIIYQIYQKSDSGKFNLPTHTYKINDDKISMPIQSYWFTRIAKSKLNSILINSIDQKKPELVIVDKKYLYALCITVFFVLTILLYRNIDVPFLKRMNGPFARAYRKIKILNKRKDKDNYVKSILILTDAFNKTFNKNINNLNINEFTDKNIKYKKIKPEIKIFVEVSSTEIYSSKTFFSKIRFNEIYNFSKILRTIERTL